MGVRRIISRLFRLLLLVALGFAIVGGVVAKRWAEEGVATVQSHLNYEVSHPGWSFPGRVYAPDPKGGPPVMLGWLLGPDTELREHLPIAEAPEQLLQAIVAAEDRNFWEHHGVNLKSIVRATLANLQEGGYSQGGSTLTMQVVRNLGGAREKTLARKAREAVVAFAVDTQLGKDTVLQAYLDAPYLGQRGSIAICGFQAAAQHYYGKNAHDLSLGEAATLAAILPSPGRYAPDRNPEGAKERRDRVLRAMNELYGTEIDDALAEPIATVPPPSIDPLEPAFFGATRAWLDARLDPHTLYGSGLIVETALDLEAQARTDALFATAVPELERLVGRRGKEPLQAAGVLLRVEDGMILALYGGRDLGATEFNRATQARRQAGSSLKPLTYALAFSVDPNLTAAETMPNIPRRFKTPEGDWSPRNVGGEYSVTASLAYALAWSQNIATASLLEHAGGPAQLKQLATAIGFDTRDWREEMGLALGQAEVTPLEMAQFAATVSGGGLKVQGRPVFRATDAAGRVVIEPPKAGPPVLDSRVAVLTRELMRLVIEQGTGGASRGVGGRLGYQGQAMGKTGTTDSEKDLWFVGATPTLAAAVWLGYDQPTPIGASASDLASPLWGWWLHAITQDVKPLPEFTNPDGMTRRWICTVSGQGAREGCKGISAPFLVGTAPKGTCPLEHPPEAEELDDPEHPEHESLWKRLKREAEEAAAAKGLNPDGTPMDPPVEPAP